MFWSLLRSGLHWEYIVLHVFLPLLHVPRPFLSFQYWKQILNSSKWIRNSTLNLMVRIILMNRIFESEKKKIEFKSAKKIPVKDKPYTMSRSTVHSSYVDIFAARVYCNTIITCNFFFREKAPLQISYIYKAGGRAKCHNWSLYILQTMSFTNSI